LKLLPFNKSLIFENCSPHRVIAFDPSYIPKSGKKTEHIGTFWSGTSGTVVHQWFSPTKFKTQLSVVLIEKTEKNQAVDIP